MTSRSALPPVATVEVTAEYLEGMRQQLAVFEQRYGVPSEQMLDVPAFRASVGSIVETQELMDWSALCALYVELTER
jgi:hypothetical protein